MKYSCAEHVTTIATALGVKAELSTTALASPPPMTGDVNEMQVQLRPTYQPQWPSTTSARPPGAASISCTVCKHTAMNPGAEYVLCSTKSGQPGSAVQPDIVCFHHEISIVILSTTSKSHCSTLPYCHLLPAAMAS